MTAICCAFVSSCACSSNSTRRDTAWTISKFAASAAVKSCISFMSAPSGIGCVGATNVSRKRVGARTKDCVEVVHE